MHTGKCLKRSCKLAGREEHSDSHHKLSRDDGNEYGRTGMYTGRAGKGPVCPPAGGAAIGSKLGLLLQRNITPYSLDCISNTQPTRARIEERNSSSHAAWSYRITGIALHSRTTNKNPTGNESRWDSDYLLILQGLL